MSKIPNHIIKEINKLSGLLPNVKEPKFEHVQGKTLIHDPTLSDSAKSKIKLQSTYRVQIPNAGININHTRRMKSEYLKKGELGYLLYFDQYVKPGPLKLEVWKTISKITNQELTEEAISKLNPPEQLTPNT